MAFSIRLSAEEKMLAESYAKLHALSLGEAYEEYKKSGKESEPIEKLWEESDL